MSNNIPTPASYDELKEQCPIDPRYRLDPTKVWPPIQYTLSQSGIGIAPRGDIQVVKAPQKNGKTFLLTLLMGALLKGEYLGIKGEIETPKLLFIDTEQHPRDTLEVYKRICKIAGIDAKVLHDNIDVLHFRGAKFDYIQEALRWEIPHYRPDVVFLDGLVDCVDDPNNQSESKSYITELSALALDNNCSIWTVLHVNPGTEKMRGHLGTILAQKVSDVLQCLKEKQPDGSVIFTVDQTDARHKDINKFSFAIGSVPNGNEIIALPVAVEMSMGKKEELIDIFADVLRSPCKGNELVERVMAKTNLKKSKAYEKINEALSIQMISKDPVFGFFSYIGLDKKNEDGMPY